VYSPVDDLIPKLRVDVEVYTAAVPAFAEGLVVGSVGSGSVHGWSGAAWICART
jgi:hypothetical protein